MSVPAEGSVVLFVCEYFAPAQRAGGGALTLVNTVARLGERFRFAVITRNHDVGDRQPFGDQPSNRWVRVGHADVYYAADRDLTMRCLLRRVAEVDPRVIYLNSLFSVLAVRMLLLRRTGRLGGRSLVIAPEGELGPGALATRPLRKRLYLRLARRVGMFRGVLWKAASAPEAELVRRWFGSAATVSVAENLSPPASGEPGNAATRTIARRRRGELELAFLSRLSPKKNLLFLLEALRPVRAAVHLGIAGPIEDRKYWRRCEVALAALPGNVRVTLCGAVPPDDVPAYLARFDAFALPTLDENYGHVVLEALAAGCYLLLSPHTPWSDIDREGVGRILDLSDPVAWRREIEALADWSDADFDRCRSLSASYVRHKRSSEEPLRELENLLADAVSRARSRPAPPAGDAGPPDRGDFLRLVVAATVEIAKNVAMALPAVRAWRLRRPRASEHFGHTDEDLERYAFQATRSLQSIQGGVRGLHIVEIGPGDYLTSGLSLLAAGATSYTVIDRFPGPHSSAAARDWYRGIAAAWPRLFPHLPWPGELDPATFPGALGDRVQILAAPIESARAERRFDVVCSFQVGEHVADVASFARATADLLTPGGVAVHRVDFGPHPPWRGYRDPLIFLRFPDWLWRCMGSNRGVSNRRRHHEVYAALAAAGLQVSVPQLECFAPDQIDVRRMNSRFRKMPPDSLLVGTAVYVCRR